MCQYDYRKSEDFFCFLTVRVESKSIVLCSRETGIFLTERWMVFKDSISRVSYFTGAVYVDGSSIVLKGETDFANNTADFGGTIVKRTLSCSLNDTFPK